jgi:hypothetical protein
MPDPAPPTPDGPADAAAAGPARCRCGHDRDHYMVSPVPSYTFLGWCLVILGISAPMTQMVFRCRTCDQVIETTTDVETMESYRHRA